MRNNEDGTIEHSNSSADAMDDATAIGRDQINGDQVGRDKISITNVFRSPPPEPRRRPPTIYDAPTQDVLRMARAHRRALWWAKVRAVVSLPVLLFFAWSAYAIVSVLPNNIAGLLTSNSAPQNIWIAFAIQIALAVWLWFHVRRFRALAATSRGALRNCERVLQQRTDYVG